MDTLSESRISELLAPYISQTGEGKSRARALIPKLSVYLDVLLRWNVRTNLTAIRGPEEIVRRHFGESLFTAARLQQMLEDGTNLLDYGSGAGFPGLPIKLYLPAVRCTLAESQGKKAAFLREAIRVLNVDAEVWAGRVEAMPHERTFSCVTMRAVDGMETAVRSASERVSMKGVLAILAGGEPCLPDESALQAVAKFAIPESDRRMLYLYARR